MLYPSHRKTPGIPDGAVLNASAQGADVVTGGGDDALDEAPADSGGGFWDRLGAWMGPGEAEAKGGKREKRNNPYPLGPESKRVDHGARVVCAETGGMRPQLIDPDGDPNDPANWVPASYERLQNARRHIAVIAMRNTDVSEYKGLDGRMEFGPIWDDCVKAAQEGLARSREVPKDVQNFYMVQRGQERKIPKWGHDDTLYEEFGPFSTTAGDIPDGDNAFIRTHGSIKRR